MNEENIEVIEDMPTASQEPIKKTRGRPRKVQEGEFMGVRDIPPGETKPKAKKSGKVDSSQIAQQFKGIHKILSIALHEPAMEISDVEAQMVGEAIADVSREFGVNLFGGKMGALLGFAAALAIVEVPRVGLIIAKRKENMEQYNNATAQNS